MATDLEPNDLSFTLIVELDIPPFAMSAQLLNLQADQNATLVDIKVEKISRYDDEARRIVDYSEEEQNTLVVYDSDTIEFVQGECTRKTFNFPSSRVTIRQFVDAIVDFEKFARPQHKWLGGIDCHHIFFEGINPTVDGGYSIFWGS